MHFPIFVGVISPDLSVDISDDNFETADNSIASSSAMPPTPQTTTTTLRTLSDFLPEATTPGFNPGFF